MFLLLALLLLLFLPDPWNLAAALVSLALGAVEIVFWERRLRRRKVETGVENLVGATGVVTQPLAPVGQIRVLGELWEARAAEELEVGRRVRVKAVRDLSLEVESADRGPERAAAGLGAVALIVAVVLALAGCGGDGGSSASEDYANDVCSSLSTWVTDVQNTIQSLTDAGLATSREDIQNAFDETKNATDTLVNDLEAAGPPDTDDGRQAQSELDSLATTLRQQLDVIEQALDSGGGVTAIAATVSTAVSTAANAVNTTYQDLKGLDPAGELQDAFTNSDDCKSLAEQLENIRSQS
jgi:membrane protein implicated in regulation of membrane protease activity